jgi:hypothetical protein
MISATEYDAFVSPLPLKDAGPVMQTVGQYVDLRVAPRDHLSVQPDPAVTVVVGNEVGGGSSHFVVLERRLL